MNSISLEKILYKSETQKQLKSPQIFKLYIFFPMILLFCFLENASPTVTAQLQGVFNNFWKAVFIHSKKKKVEKKYNWVTTLQTTHYIKRESLKQEAEFPKELLETHKPAICPFGMWEGLQSFPLPEREYLTERMRCSLAKTTLLITKIFSWLWNNNVVLKYPTDNGNSSFLFGICMFFMGTSRIILLRSLIS